MDLTTDQGIIDYQIVELEEALALYLFTASSHVLWTGGRHWPAAIYGQGLARDEGGGLRGQEHHSGRHLLRSPRPPQGVEHLALLQVPLNVFVSNATSCKKLSQNDSWIDRIDTNSQRSDLKIFVKK